MCADWGFPAWRHGTFVSSYLEEEHLFLSADKLVSLRAGALRVLLTDWAIATVFTLYGKSVLAAASATMGARM